MMRWAAHLFYCRDISRNNKTGPDIDYPGAEHSGTIAQLRDADA